MVESSILYIYIYIYIYILLGVYNSDSVCADDLGIRRKIAFLTIPFASHESIFANDLMRQS